MHKVRYPTKGVWYRRLEDHQEFVSGKLIGIGGLGVSGD